MAGRSPRERDWGNLPRDEWGTLFTDRGEEKVETLPGRYQSFYENVRDAIAGHASLTVTPEQALATIEIIEMASRA